MRKTAALLIACAAQAAFASQWAYSTRHDTFERATVRTATAWAPSPAGAGLTLTFSSTGTKSASFTGLRFDCFPACTVRIKFDDAEPEDFAARTQRLLGTTLWIDDFERFNARLSAARSVTIRSPAHDGRTDLQIAVPGPIEASGWERAERRAAARKQCEANAAREDFATCWTRAQQGL